MKRALIGTGAHAREVISIINRNQTNIESISCMFVDDVYYNESDIRLIQPLSLFNPIEYEVIVAIGDSKIREIVVNSLPKNTKFFTYIDPTAIIGELVSFGGGVYRA